MRRCIPTSNRGLQQRRRWANSPIGGCNRSQWLTTLVGYQPTDPIGTQTWTSAVRDIATWRTRHHHTADVGIPPVLDDTARKAWEALSTRLIHTKAWLDHRNPPTAHWPHRRSLHQLVTRRTELDQIFETAPADQQPLIARLRRGDPQLLDDTAETLTQDRYRDPTRPQALDPRTLAAASRSSISRDQ
jgi:hypothetical protein